MKKILAFGIILLFIGVAIAPSINFSVAKASNDNDLVEVTTQACGIKGYGNTTVKLTREQYQDLEQYLVEFRARLNQTTTREEAIPLFKEAAVELNKYGLLPRGMSVEQAQKLVIAESQNELMIKLLEKAYDKYLDNSSDFIENYFCLIAGKTVNTLFFTPVAKLLVYSELFTSVLYFIFFLIYDVLFYGLIPGGHLIMDFLIGILGFIDTMLAKYDDILKKKHFFIGCDIDIYGYGYNGWIYTIGLNGIKKINGSLYGQISHLIEIINDVLGPDGVKYFNGLRIKDNSGVNFFFGSALRVKIGLTSLYQ